MEEAKRKKLQEIGVDTDTLLHQFMDVEPMMDKYMQKFLSDQSYLMLERAIAAENAEAAFEAIHMLKGVCSICSFSYLEEKVISLTELLRHKKSIEVDWKVVRGMQKEIRILYEEVIRVLHELYV